MGNKLMTAGCFLGAILGLLSLLSGSTEGQRLFRLVVAATALGLMLTGGVMMARESRKGGD